MLSALVAVALCAPPERVELVFGGDVIPHTAVKNAARPGWAQVFGPLAEPFRRADIAVVNLETPLTENPKAVTAEMLFNAPAALALGLKTVGVTIASFANNHCLDQHRPGIVETRRHLAAAGLLSVGCDASEAQAWEPLVVERHGLRIGFLAFTRFLNDFHNASDPKAPHVPLVHYDTDPETGGYDEDELLPLVKAAAAKCDALVVMPHWGDEYQPKPKRSDRQLAMQLVEAGAAAVVGHHPHVVQPIETVVRADGTEAVVAYSLGNLVSNQDAQNALSAKREGLLLRLVLARPTPGASVRVTFAEPLPVWTENGGDALSKAKRLQPLVVDHELETIDARLGVLAGASDRVSQGERVLLERRRALLASRRDRVLGQLPLEFHPPGFSPPR